jgi:hypothetical protein
LVGNDEGPVAHNDSVAPATSAVRLITPPLVQFDCDGHLVTDTPLMPIWRRVQT